MKAHEIFDVNNRSILITGGASGIGLAMARVLAENGAKVAIVDVDHSAIENVRSVLGNDALTAVVDVRDREAVEGVFDTFDSRLGGIDAVFANAGVGGSGGFVHLGGAFNPQGAIDSLSTADWDQVIAVNLSGVRNTLAAAARVMKARGRGGRIIVTSSAAAFTNVPYVSTAYHATKAAVTHLARQVAMELAPHGILVNSIAPANFLTNIGDGALHNQEVQAQFARMSLLGRVAETEEIGGLALLLASKASSYITGTQIVIDGGCSLKGSGY